MSNLWTGRKCVTWFLNNNNNEIKENRLFRLLHQEIKQAVIQKILKFSQTRNGQKQPSFLY